MPLQRKILMGAAGLGVGAIMLALGFGPQSGGGGRAVSTANLDVAKHNALVEANDEVIGVLDTLWESGAMRPKPLPPGQDWTPDGGQLPTLSAGKFALARDKFHRASTLPGSAPALEAAAKPLVAALDAVAPTENNLQAYVDTRGYGEDHGRKGQQLTSVLIPQAQAVNMAETGMRDAIDADNMARSRTLLGKLPASSREHAAMQASLDSREAYGALTHAGPAEHRDYTAFTRALQALETDDATLRTSAEQGASDAYKQAYRSFSSEMDTLVGQGRHLVEVAQAGGNTRIEVIKFVRIYNAGVAEMNAFHLHAP
ncbi:MAG: DUF3829 domain-containing protein [Janthinobacterium lividum]